MDSILLLILWVVFTYINLKIFHKLFYVLYFNLGKGILAEVFVAGVIAAFETVILGSFIVTAIEVIFSIIIGILGIVGYVLLAIVIIAVVALLVYGIVKIVKKIKNSPKKSKDTNNTSAQRTEANDSVKQIEFVADSSKKENTDNNEIDVVPENISEITTEEAPEEIPNETIEEADTSIEIIKEPVIDSVKPEVTEVVLNVEKDDKMFCTSCGNKIARNSKFCCFCGATVTYKK